MGIPLSLLHQYMIKDSFNHSLNTRGTPPTYCISISLRITLDHSSNIKARVSPIGLLHQYMVEDPLDYSPNTEARDTPLYLLHWYIEKDYPSTILPTPRSEVHEVIRMFHAGRMNYEFSIPERLSFLNFY
ncbi:hypothetical protein VNO78_31879 [Psophocarpus tetragonolobus]|uniref:Uncharacterized protein n=1 Tax=Psophocarpus tetragonolobus TaxID=3891 RepID=A0AAN9S129_PSOTE